MRICKVKNCGKKHQAWGYCCKHYHHLQRNGKILKRTIRDKNKIFNRGKYFEIALYNIQSKIIGYTKFDKNNLKIITKLKWGLPNTGYATNVTYLSKNKNKITLMHRLIMNCPKGMEVDHINLDKLDNRKENLRICTSTENSQNKRKHNNSFSRFKGLIWRKDTHKWSTRIKVNKKSINLGCFKSEILAAISYNNAAKKYFGKYARLNIIPKN